MQFSGTTPPTSQRSGLRPISFVLDNGGSIGSPVILKVRPEDLTRNEPARATVNQTLGREVSGWVDHFGEGLPSVSISGHTGWRDVAGSGVDGARAFDQLNQLVAHDFPAAKQAAIDRGSDPADVKLLFVDMLDDFAWSVVPTTFTLRRNKSSPLLYRYNISLHDGLKSSRVFHFGGKSTHAHVYNNTVITGSFNFTKAAEESNAENLLILRSASLASRYTTSFLEHREHSTPYAGR